MNLLTKDSTNLPTPKNKIEEIELAMFKGIPKELEVKCPLKHHFSPGVYVREITMPAGSIILGHEHTTKHLNIISKGACVLADPETGEIVDIVAPCTFESDAGVRKLLYIVEECVWSTVHVTEETDIEKLEESLINPSDLCKATRTKDKYIGGR